MPHRLDEFVATVLSLPVLRPGADFFSGESPSVLCLDLLLNQRVGVERATAANLALHYHFANSKLRIEGAVSAVTKWPYAGVNLRIPARSLTKLIARSLQSSPDGDNTLISALDAKTIGALASLERYYNRVNTFFDPLRQVELSSETFRSISVESFARITGQNFPAANVKAQLASVAALLEMKRTGVRPELATLLRLDRVGEETAATLLVYLFKQPAIIYDEYLKRVFYRHLFLNAPKGSARAIQRQLSPLIATQDQAHRLHARCNEIGVLHCHAENPSCDQCPLRQLEHRT